MSTGLASFTSAKSRPYMRPTKITEGLNAVGEVKGKSLHEAFGTEQFAQLSLVESKIFSSTDKYNGKMMIGMTEAKGNIKIINSNGFRWNLVGGSAAKARVTKRVVSDAFAGIRNSQFQIVVDKPWFSVSDVVIPESENYPCRVMSVDTSRNTRGNTYNQFTYTLQLVTDDPNHSLPSKYLDLNREWCVVSSAVATEDNIDAGGFQFFTMFQSEGYVQQFAKKYSMSDKAARRLKQWTDGKIGHDGLTEEAASMKNATKAVWTTVGRDSMTGEPITRFMNLFEAELSNELYRAVDYAMQFGRSSQSMVSPEGHQIFTTSGLREQLESGHVYPFSGSLTMGELEAFFDYILKDRVALGEQKIVMSAGKRFRHMFDAMVKAEASQFTTIDTLFIREGIDGIRHLDFGSYFTMYRGLDVDIAVTQNNAYDNHYYCPEKDPSNPSYTLSSSRADILDFGYAEEQGTGRSSNISMIAESYLDYDIRFNGKWKAYDGSSALPITDGSQGYTGGVSGFTHMKEKSAGLMIGDVSRCGTIYKIASDQSSVMSNIAAPADWFIF